MNNSGSVCCILQRSQNGCKETLTSSADDEVFASRSKAYEKEYCVTDMNVFDKYMLRRAVYEFHNKEENPTTSNLRKYIGGGGGEGDFLNHINKFYEY
jgi:hypothetical protein